MYLAFYSSNLALAARPTKVQLEMSAVFKPYAGVSYVTELTAADVPKIASADDFQNYTVISM